MSPQLRITLLLICAATTSTLAQAAEIAADNRIVAFPENGSTLTVLRDGQPYFSIEVMGWEPNWKYLGLRGEIVESGELAILKNSTRTSNGAEISSDLQVEQSGSRQLKICVETSTSKDTKLLYLVAAVTMDDRAFSGGNGVADLGNEGHRELRFPLGKAGLGNSVRGMNIVDSEGGETSFIFKPACSIPTDGAFRLVLAEGLFKAGQTLQQTITIDLPEDYTFLPGPGRIPFEAGFEDWFEFTPDTDHDAPSEISMQDWLDAPAGKYGRILRNKERLVYNAKPIKLWGLNLCFGACAPEKEMADKRAAFYSKYGINAVRLHKYADGSGWAGIQSPNSFVEFDPDGLDRMDYQVAAFKKRGIYVKFSAHFGSQKLGPEDIKYVPYLEEFGTFSERNKRITTPHSAVHYSPELQRVQIQQMVNLLRHKNPYTGMRYAEDPAVAFVEIINEQSILFYSSMDPLKKSPTLRTYVAKKYCDWLRERYGTQEDLMTAWGGQEAFDSFSSEGFPPVGEHLEKENILPLGNPWYFDPENLAGSQAYRRQRLLDTMWFLYELQNEFYSRFVMAMRKAGYKGEIVASNWQAGRGYSHFCNLHSDALVGTVDRHNYFGGGSNSRINDATMLFAPGSGTLSVGMQQVADRPFMLSEWIHVAPNEWGVEGPAVIGAYGMGLQGWDVSFMFQNRDNGTFSDRIGKDRWDVTAPQVLGIFPAVARQVLRGDVTEGELLAPIYVHVPSLAEGRLGLEDKVTQQYDVKTFSSDQVPASSLAVARAAVRFSDSYLDTPVFKPDTFLSDGFLVSATGQLRWKAGESKLDGFFTINTRATQAVIGFAENETCEFDSVVITPKSRFGAIYVTAKELDKTLEDSQKILVIAVGRARNKGMKVFGGNRIIDRGESPVVMEPIIATLLFRRPGNPTVHLLDHNGRKTGNTLPILNGLVEIDGTRDQTCYYLIHYGEKEYR